MLKCLSKIKASKELKIVVAIIIFCIFCSFGLPLFQILIEIISKAGRITGTFIRLNC